ncbi:MAG: Xaa-Pro dipeptidyl-peptidase [Gemmatimonadales bacterium]|nr:Xaa-Pro dipeptidyl-peptidase [Gemmatimonadales bacterium]
MSPRPARCRAAALLAATLALASSLPAQQAKTVPVFIGGQAQIVPGFADTTQWIRQTLWVETEFDSDGDGKRDRMFVDVTRQRQTETEGLKVPVIYESSPYYSRTSGPRQFLWDVKQEVGATPPRRTSQPQIEYVPSKAMISPSFVRTWVPRGFAVVHSEAPGTGLSQGCVTVGGPPEELAPKAVIDWLNGRAKGYTTPTGTEEVRATWTTGKVGMTGTSYNGTIPVAAATTGVEGLEAIIPVAPNTSYWHYYRSHGLVRHPGGWLGEDIDFLYDFVNSGNPATRAYCNATYRDGMMATGRDRTTGDYNAFWANRDLRTKAGKIRAATLMAHAFNDWNVVPEHSQRIVEVLKANKVPVQQYYHQGGHGGEPPMVLMNRWFTRYLFGIENGVERDPKAFIVREGASMQAPTPYRDFPNPDAKAVMLGLGRGGKTAGTLALQPGGGQGRETLVDNVEFSGGVLAKAADSPNRLIYATPILSEAVHLSGTTQVRIRMALNKPAGNLSVWMVSLPWTEAPNALTSLITRGWADPQNWKQLTTGGDYHSLDRGTPLVPGQFVDLTFDLEPDDQIIPAGKRIAVMIMSSDRDFTLWPAAGTELTVDLDHTSVTIPVVGGKKALDRALKPTH